MILRFEFDTQRMSLDAKKLNAALGLVIEEEELTEILNKLNDMRRRMFESGDDLTNAHELKGAFEFLEEICNEKKIVGHTKAALIVLIIYAVGHSSGVIDGERKEGIHGHL